MSIEVKGLKENLRILGKIDPALRREFGKRFRELAKPGVEAIDQIRPTGDRFPRGFQHSGRTGAGTAKKPTIDINTRRARTKNLRAGATYETVGTIRIRTARGDVATAIADMAGKTGNIQTSGRSRSYPRRPTGHALNGQGAGLIRGLNKHLGAPSRFMWPGTERGLTGMEREFVALAAAVEDEINREVMKIGTTANEIRAKMR